MNDREKNNNFLHAGQEAKHGMERRRPEPEMRPSDEERPAQAEEESAAQALEEWDLPDCNLPPERDLPAEWVLPPSAEMELNRMLEAWAESVRWEPERSDHGIVIISGKIDDERWRRRFARFPFKNDRFIPPKTSPAYLEGLNPLTWKKRKRHLLSASSGD